MLESNGVILSSSRPEPAIFDPSKKIEMNLSIFPTFALTRPLESFFNKPHF